MGKAGALFTAVLLLAGCEREPPTPVAVAPRPASETLEPAQDHYVDARQGFAIAVPRGWTGPGDGASALFEAEHIDAELRLTVASPGADAMRDGVDAQGYMVRTRRLRARSGAVVSATMRYPLVPPSLDTLALETLETLQPVPA